MNARLRAVEETASGTAGPKQPWNALVPLSSSIFPMYGFLLLADYILASLYIVLCTISSLGRHSFFSHFQS